MFRNLSIALFATSAFVGGAFAQIALPETTSFFHLEDKATPKSMPLTIDTARTINTEQIKSIREQIILVDVMAPSDKQGLFGQPLGIKGAFWLPALGDRSVTMSGNNQIATFLERVTNGVKTQPIAFYCTGIACARSATAAKRASEMGYSDVLWYRGGINSWMTSGGPTQDMETMQ